MTTGMSGVTTTMVQVQIIQEQFPPYHDLHGTPHTMTRRLFTFELPGGSARWEQSDYGHPGQFNPPEPRGIPAALQSKTGLMQAAVEALARLLA